MDVVASRGPLRYLHDVPDPRAANISHPLPSLLAITLMAVICGEDDYQGVVEWADVREDGLATFLDLPHGVPWADTIERVFARLDPDALERAFIAFTQGVAERSEGRLVAVDGKTLRRSFDHGGRKAAIHMVNAWDHANGLVLGQLAVKDKSNEIEAVPRLLEFVRRRRDDCATAKIARQRTSARTSNCSSMRRSSPRRRPTICPGYHADAVDRPGGSLGQPRGAMQAPRVAHRPVHHDAGTRGGDVSSPF